MMSAKARDTMSRWIAVILSFPLFTAGAAQAAVERLCVVSVNVSNGWSPERKNKIVFVTGLELSRIRKSLKTAPSFQFDFHENYALIWQGNGLPIVARIDEVVLGVRQQFTADDFQRFFEHHSERQATQIEGEGRGLKWRIKGRTAVGWVDPGM